MKNTAYKIESASNWSVAIESGVYSGSGIDVIDGFIHLSAKSQVLQTFAKYFAGKMDLLLIEVNLDLLGDTVKWEVSRGGELFPHIYGTLPMAAVIATHLIEYDSNGNAIFPQEF